MIQHISTKVATQTVMPVKMKITMVIVMVILNIYNTSNDHFSIVSMTTSKIFHKHSC